MTEPEERIYVHLDLVCPRGHFIRKIHIVLAPPGHVGPIIPIDPGRGTPPDELGEGDPFIPARMSPDAERRIKIDCPNPTCTYIGPKKLSELHDLILREALNGARRIRLPD